METNHNQRTTSIEVRAEQPHFQGEDPTSVQTLLEEKNPIYASCQDEAELIRNIITQNDDVSKVQREYETLREENKDSYDLNSFSKKEVSSERKSDQSQNQYSQILQKQNQPVVTSLLQDLNETESEKSSESDKEEEEENEQVDLSQDNYEPKRMNFNFQTQSNDSKNMQNSSFEYKITTQQFGHGSDQISQIPNEQKAGGKIDIKSNQQNQQHQCEPQSSEPVQIPFANRIVLNLQQSVNRQHEGLYSSSSAKDTQMCGSRQPYSGYLQSAIQSRDCQPKQEIPTNNDKFINNQECQSKINQQVSNTKQYSSQQFQNGAALSEQYAIQKCKTAQQVHQSEMIQFDNQSQMKDNAGIKGSQSLHNNTKNSDEIFSKPQVNNSVIESSISSAQKNNNIGIGSAATSGSQNGSMVLNKNYSPIFNNTYIQHQQPQESHHSQQQQENLASQIPPNQGRWNKGEHCKFLEALKIFGKNWKKVQLHVQTRTSTQARSHAQKFFVKLERKGLDYQSFLNNLDISNLNNMASELLEFEEDDENHGELNTPLTPTGGFQNSAEIDTSIKVGQKRPYDSKSDTPKHTNLQVQNKPKKINGVVGGNEVNVTFNADKRTIEQQKVENSLLLKAAEDLKAHSKVMQQATTKEIFRIHPPSASAVPNNNQQTSSFPHNHKPNNLPQNHSQQESVGLNSQVKKQQTSISVDEKAKNIPQIQGSAVKTNRAQTEVSGMFNSNSIYESIDDSSMKNHAAQQYAQMFNATQQAAQKNQLNNLQQRSGTLPGLELGSHMLPQQLLQQTNPYMNHHQQLHSSYFPPPSFYSGGLGAFGVSPLSLLQESQQALYHHQAQQTAAALYKLHATNQINSLLYKTPQSASLYGAAASLGLTAPNSLIEANYIQSLLASQTPVVYTALDAAAGVLPGSSQMNYYSNPNQFFEGLGLNTTGFPQQPFPPQSSLFNTVDQLRMMKMNQQPPFEGVAGAMQPDLKLLQQQQKLHHQQPHQ